MYTVIYELYRAEGWTREQFVEYWLHTHRPIAMTMPNLRGYKICPVTDSGEVLGDEVDGFVMLVFDSEDDFNTTHESPEFAATAADARKFTRHFARYAVDVHDVIPAGV